MSRPVPPGACVGPDGEPILPYAGEDPVRAVRAFPAWSPQDRDFDVAAEIALAQSAAQVFTTVVSFTAPAGNDAVGLWWGADVNVCTAWADLLWRIRVSGDVRLGPYTGWQMAGMRPDEMPPIHVFFRGGETLYLEASNPNATTRTIRGRLKGMFGPGQMRRNG